MWCGSVATCNSCKSHAAGGKGRARSHPTSDLARAGSRDKTAGDVVSAHARRSLGLCHNASSTAKAGYHEGATFFELEAFAEAVRGKRAVPVTRGIKFCEQSCERKLG